MLFSSGTAANPLGWLVRAIQDLRFELDQLNLPQHELRPPFLLPGFGPGRSLISNEKPQFP